MTNQSTSEIVITIRNTTQNTSQNLRVALDIISFLLSCDKPISSHTILIPDIYPISKVSRHLARPPTPQIASWFHPRRITLRYTQITPQFPKVTKPGLGNTPPCKINGLAQKIFRKNSTNLTKSILTFIFISNIATPQTSIYVGADVVLFFCGDQGLAP